MSLNAAKPLQERAAHHACGWRDLIEQLEGQLALIYQHPRAVRMRAAKRDRLAEKGRRLGAIDGVVEETFDEVAA